MKCSTVYVATFLSGAALGAIGGGYEHGDHGSSTVAVGSTTASEVISTEINLPTGASEVVSEGTTRVSVTLISSVTETATGVPGTAIYGEKQPETVSSSVVSRTTASVGSTISSESSASSSAAVSTETNEAVTGSATSSGSFSEVDSTIRLTTTIIQTTGLPTLTHTVSSINWSSINWTSISMDTQPTPVTSTQTSVSVTNLPQSTAVTTDVVETSVVVSSQVTSESTISTYKPSSSAIKTLTSAPYSMVNSTQLNSGVGATGVPQYLNGTASATGTGSLTYTSATIPAQPTFSGDAVNLLNHNYALLAEIAAALAALFGHGALI